MRIAIGCDHVGFALKASIVDALEGDEHAVLDLGVHAPDPVDYPAMAKAVATALVKGFVDFGVLVCETSLGSAIAANKFTGIRAVACRDADTARSSRVRLNANFLCLGGSEVDGDGAATIVREWLSASFSGDERDVRELAAIEQIAEIAHRGRADEKTLKAATHAPTAPGATPMPASPGATEPPVPAPPSPVEPPAPVEISPPPTEFARVPDISALLRYLAALKDEDVQLMARRVLEVIRNRFPAAEGTPTPDGFTFTLEGKHVATVHISKKHIELEVGPEHVVPSRIRDLDGLEIALSLPTVLKGFDAVRS